MSPIDPELEAFLDAVAGDDGHPALSEAKMLALASPDASVIVREHDEIVAAGVVGLHLQEDGSTHCAVETAVRRAMRFDAFERAVVEAVRGIVPRGVSHSVWSSRSSLDRALEDLGYGVVRSLVMLEVALPIASMEDVSRPLRPDEADELIRVNNDAFAGHREAGHLTATGLAAVGAEPWFQWNGIRVIDGEDGLAAFCWTKVHPDGRGEIYRIGVSSSDRGRGLGRTILAAGFHHLAASEGVTVGMLWVDEANRPAIALYESVGMTIRRTNREWEPALQPKR